MPLFTNPWRVLGVSPSVTRDEVRQKYKTLALQLHPDKTEGKTQEPFVKAHAAYEQIMEDIEERELRERATSIQEKGGHESSTRDRPRQDRPPASHRKRAHYEDWNRQSSSHPPGPGPGPPPPWPTRHLPTSLPASPCLPSDMKTTNSTQTYTHSSLHNLHSAHVNRLHDLTLLSIRLNNHLHMHSLIHCRPLLFIAATHLSSFLLSESRLHCSLFHHLEKTRWWTKPRSSSSGALARQQVRWYVATWIEGTMGKLEEMRVWLEMWLLTYVVDERVIGEELEVEFEERMRRWCPVDEGDEGARMRREGKTER